MALFNEVNAISGIAFTGYVTGGLFVLLNVVTGVFIDKAMRTASKSAKAKAVTGITSAFAEESRKGHLITWELFHDKMHEPEMSPFLEEMNITSNDSKKFFEILDTDGTGVVQAGELLDACLRLQGEARAFDVAKIMQMHKNTTRVTHDHLERMNSQMIAKH